MGNSVGYLLGFIVFLGFATFIGAVVWASVISLKGADISTFPEIASGLITSISGLLAINLGAVLGFSISHIEAFSYAHFQNPFAFLNDPTIYNLQISACYIYILSLMIATVVWGIKGFKKDAVVAVLTELTKSFIGVILGALAVVLAKPK